MKLRIKNTKLTLTVIGWLQIIGGITGIALVAYLMLQTGTINGTLLFIFIVGLALFIYSLYAGSRLLIDKEKRKGIIFSIMNQIPQIFQWSILGYGLSYSSGAELTLGIQGLTVKFDFSIIASNFKMAIRSDDDFFIKINVIAVLVIFVLVDILHELKKQRRTAIEQESSTKELGVE